MIVMVLVLLGLCLGSFISALVWRLRQQELASQKSKVKQKDQFSIIRGRSMCPNCKHILAWYDLIPIISWLSLKGNCRYCKKPISWQYPLVELSTAALFVLSYVALQPTFHFSLFTFHFILWLAMLVLLIALFIYDLRWMILPNKLIFPLIGLALAHVIIVLVANPRLSSLLLPIAGSLIVSSGLFYALFRISDGKWIGGGDVKLGFAYGLLLSDPLRSVIVLFLASLLGTLAILPALFASKLSMKTKIPFGPLLIIATIVVYLYGDKLINWYSAYLIYR